MKTLNDLHYTAECPEETFKKVLREEAREWVKKLTEREANPNHGPCCYCMTCGYGHDDCVCTYRNAKIVWIKEFFNLEG